jgi:biofilm PGA synthesis N-glycosyltransferase PgaC
MTPDTTHWLPSLIFGYVFYYPFFMAWVWMAGGLAHVLVFERKRHLHVDPLTLLPSTPMVSVIVPCHNEAAQVEEVLAQLMNTRYPHYEVLAVNDGSTDSTGAILDKLAERWPQLRVVHNSENQGKAVGLNTAVLLAKGEFIFGIDGDALIDPDAIAWLLRPMLASAAVGAVTGNPRIRNRTSLIGRMQVGEFSSTIGLIKRTQQIFGRLFTVSGVIAMFRRKALVDAGFWATDVLTEDIDISWKLQLAGWTIRFEPRALAWILMPETLRGLYHQRQRWATGGIQTVLRYSTALLRLRHWRMWGVWAEYLLSVLWAYAMLLVLVLAIAGMFLRHWLPPAWQVGFLPEWRGTLLGLTCMAQMFVSLWIDRYYDRDLLRYFLWTIWYPLAFWMINMVTTVIALPRALLRRTGKRAIWRSPDRGVTHAP